MKPFYPSLPGRSRRAALLFALFPPFAEETFGPFRLWRRLPASEWAGEARCFSYDLEIASSKIRPKLPFTPAAVSAIVPPRPYRCPGLCARGSSRFGISYQEALAMKRVWIPVVGLLLIAVIAAFADSAMEPADATGTVAAAKAKNPAVKPAPKSRCCHRSARAPEICSAAVTKPFVRRKLNAPPSQFGLGSHAVGTTAESAAASPPKPQTTSDWLGLKRVGH